ncbi:MAG: glycosyltransferase family 2 protein [Mycobacterium sp.]
MADTYLVAIASYRRPEGLRKLLDSLQDAIGSTSVEILVVDNDSEETARTVATQHALQPLYVVECEPGIAAARNRALDHFSDRFRGIIFVDDDEWVSPSWLTTLTSYADRSGADVVLGPVVSEYPDETPGWVRRGGFIQRRIREDGQELRSAATNNTLLLRDAWIRAGAPRFDPSFSATGGSDTDLFHGIRKSGARILFCAGAIVYEEVPVERLTFRWLRRRAIRNGIVDTRVRIKHQDSLLRGLGGGVIRAGYGILFLAAGLATGRGLQARPFENLFNAYGRFAALLNVRIREYARVPVK